MRAHHKLVAMKSPVFLMMAMLLTAWAPGSAQSKSIKPLAVGDMFPRLEGEFLTGRKAILPDAASGRFALVLMGFTYQSRFSVESWAEHVRPAFAQRGHATFYEVPVLGGLARLGKWFIDSGMRSGTPKDLHENVITLWGDVDRWKALMNFSDAAQDDGYLTLIDQKGRVLWLYRGSYTADAFDAMLKLTRE
jgi:hypothetical protein